MSAVQLITVTRQDADLRVDRWFKRHFPELPHGYVEKLLRKGQIRVDGGRARSNQRLEEGQVIRVPPIRNMETPAPKAFNDKMSEQEVQDLRDRVLFKDDDVIALNKPAGLAVQGGSKVNTHLDGMLDALRFGRQERPKLAHRLDKDTSGVLVLGRSAASTAKLAEAFQTRQVRKLYWALVVGRPLPQEGTIDAPLSKLGGHGRERMELDRAMGKKAISNYRTVSFAGRRITWLELEPRTGRTHQLRAHTSLLGTPILGDGKYGGQGAFVDGEDIEKKLHLHARAIALPLADGRMKIIEAPLSGHFAKSLAYFGFTEDEAGQPFEALPDV